MTFKYNKDQARRDTMIPFKRLSYGDLAYFKGLNHKVLKILLDEKFADPNERQNESPTIKEFYDFMVKYPEFTAHGYATTLERYKWEGEGGYRITIEGLEGWVESSEALSAFIKTFQNADELDVDEYKSLRCWYD